MAEEKKNKFQQRIDEQAAAMEKAYADLRETYDDPTDEQILAVAGNNLRGYQRKMGNTAGNWGTAFGSNAMWGTLNKNTRDALEAGYQAGLEATKKALPDKRAESVYTLGEGEGAKKVTKGMQMDARNWGDNIKDTENITPEQVRKLNEIMKTGGFTEFAIPTTQVTTKNEQGEDVVTDVEQNTSLYDLLESATPEEIEALEYLGFIDDYDGSYTRPHNETFDEKLARKEREQARIDLLTQQRALERQRARTGLADLAAGVGDMIKASNGAIVTPRDYQAMYDTLTAQQKVNYNNYLARMQAMKEAEKAKAKEAADRAYQERLLTEQRAYQEEQARKAQEFQAAESEKNRKHQEAMLSDKLENQRAIQQMKNDAAIGRLFMNLQSKEAMQSAKYGDSIPYGGSIIPISMNKSDALYQGIYGLIETTIRNHPAYVNELASIDEAYLETNPERVRVIVASALTNPSVVLPREINEKIQQYINDAKVSQESKDKKGDDKPTSQVTGSADFITPASKDVSSNAGSSVNISLLGNNIMNQLQSQ